MYPAVCGGLGGGCEGCVTRPPYSPCRLRQVAGLPTNVEFIKRIALNREFQQVGGGGGGPVVA